MNDWEIRLHFHKKELRHCRDREDTIIIDELGLNHGKNRADIAVINGSFTGYEIKSNNDSFFRLKEQIKSYNSVFDNIYIIVGDRHIKTVQKNIPAWWGIITVFKNKKDSIIFDALRKANINKSIDPISVARLLWRNEALEVLKQKQISGQILRKPRAILYQALVDILNTDELKKIVRDFLKKRKDWRHPAPLSRYVDLYQPSSK